LLGHEKVPIPKGPEDVDGWSKFSKALGIPDKAEGYGLADVQVPEALKDLTFDKQKFAETVHAFKLTPSQAKGLWEAYTKMTTESYSGYLKQHQTNMVNVVNQLRSEWGDTYEANVQLGQMVISKFAADKETEDFITANLAKDPRGVKFIENMVKDIASKYKTQYDFRKNEPKAYDAAKRYGWFDNLGLKSTFNTWDYESVKNEALRYKNRNEFRKNNIGAYDYAKRNNILDDITKHMERRTQWTKDLAQIEAFKYNTRIDFAKNSKKAYDAAIKYGWIEDITKHMVPKRKNQFS
jgi:hypothetical protein